MESDRSKLVMRVVREGRTWVVVDKPSGLLSVPGKGDAPEKKDCVPARVKALYPDATGPLVVHRLDMDTSGLMVVALTAEAQRHLSNQFASRWTKKRYVALLDGLVDRESGEVRLPLRLDPDHRPWQVVDGLHGRDSLTRWKLLALETDRSRVEFEPVTGRAHQLRVHAAVSEEAGGIGRCIIGDVLYGSGYRGPLEGERGRMAPAERLMLHATFLSFDDPETGERVECVSKQAFGNRQ